MKNNLIKRIVSFALALVICFGMLPSTALKASASSGDTVYLSASYDGRYITDKNGKEMCLIPVKYSELSSIKLENYTAKDPEGINDVNMSYYSYDGDGDGTEDITLLHLYIYIHEKLCGKKWEDVRVSGDFGSLFFNAGLFGYADCNLMYYINGKYPLMYDGWGATAETSVLQPGDFADVAGYSSWMFYFDSNTGFKYFVENGTESYTETAYENITHSYTAKAGEETTVTLFNGFTMMGVNYNTMYFGYNEGEIFYSKTAFDEGAPSVWTDSEGLASITFSDAGTWYIWSYGDYGIDNDGGSIVNAPAFATVYVEGDSTETVNNPPALKEGVSAEATAAVTQNLTYTVNLSDIFTDAESDTLTYYVKINDGEYQNVSGSDFEYTPATAGTHTLVFKANDGNADSATYKVTLTVTEAVKEFAEIKAFTVFYGSDPTPSNSNVLISDNNSYTDALKFSKDTKEYNVTTTILDTENSTLSFGVQPENTDYTVTLYKGDTKVDEIKTSSGEYKSIANLLTVGKNEFGVVVSSENVNVEPTTYKFTISVTPTLKEKILTVDCDYPVYIADNLGANDISGNVVVPESATSIELLVEPTKDVAVTYNGSENNVVDISNTNIVEIVVSKDGISRVYKINLTKVKEKNVKFNITPDNTTLRFEDNTGKLLTSNADGSYDVIFYQVNNTDKIKYTYTVEKEDYVTKSVTIGSFDGEELVVDVTLSKELGPQPVEIEDVDWKNFRNSDENMAITSVKTPTDKVALKWSKKLGDGWGNSPSVAIIVDNCIITMAGKTLYKMDAQTGEVKATGSMVDVPSWGYTPPTYANGMIFCPLGNGKIQAFNATTLESLWVYTDTKGGQANTPIIYSDGYIYTGFWNGEDRDANFVCLDVIDYDTDSTNENKPAEWTKTHNGGFYWAGAVAIGDAVIVGSDDGGAEGTVSKSTLYSFNKYTGEIISQIDLVQAGDQRSSISYDKENRKIYFTTKGGYLYSAKVNSDGTVTDLKGVDYDAQMTSTPVVYKGKVYFGKGSGIRTDGSEGSFVVADANTLEKLFEIEMKGYPQTSPLLSTAYEESGWLYFYLTYNDIPGGISLVKVKTDAQTAADAQLVEIYDAAGCEQFCIASIICGEDGTLYYKNDSATFIAVAPASADIVINLINAIGDTVTLESEGAIIAAREAYDSLTATEKALVTNYDKLVAAEKALKELLDAEDKAVAETVDKLISEIGKVKLESYSKIEKARKAYNKLTDNQKEFVTKLSTLEKAEKEAVEQVEKLIDDIGDVDLDSAEDIAKAKKAYNWLPAYLQEKVDNYKTMIKAEK